MKKWTPDEDRYILDHYKDTEWSIIADTLDRSINSVKCHAKSLNIQRKEYGTFFTPEEDQWLIENVPCYKYEDLAKMFSEKFNRPCTQFMLRSRATRYLHIKSGRQGFKKGSVTHNVKPIGYEYFNHVNGYTYIKTSNTGVKNKDFRPKHQLVYEQYKGKIPKGHIVIFLDGDRQNFDPDNLYALNRYVHRMMCSKGYFREGGRELTLAAIKLYELEYAIKNAENV